MGKDVEDDGFVHDSLFASTNLIGQHVDMAPNFLEVCKLPIFGLFENGPGLDISWLMVKSQLQRSPGYNTLPEFNYNMF